MKFLDQSAFGHIISATKNDVLQAAVLTAKLNETAYYIMPFSTDAGKKSGAMHHVIYNMNTTLPKIKYFDFEGSDLPGVQRFIKGFHPEHVPYPFIKW